MNTMARPKMNRVQIVRGSVFLTLLLFHCDVPYTSIFWAGIECFFLLSAFFLTRKLINADMVSVKKQILHRIRHLSLPYIFVLVLAAVQALLLHKIPFDFVPHIVFGQNFLWMFTGYSSSMQPMTAHLWTMTVEVWGGFLWLLVLKVLPKRGWRRAMYVCLACSVVLRTVFVLFKCDPLIITLNPVSHIDAFALGSLLAIQLEEDRQENILKMSWIMGAIGIAGLVISWIYLMMRNQIGLLDAYALFNDKNYYLTNPTTGNIYLYISLVFYWLIARVSLKDSYKNGVCPEGRLGRFMKYLGDKSYVLYLFHWPILWVLKFVCSKFSLNGFARWGLLLTIGGTLTFTAMVIFERYIEPWLKKLGGRIKWCHY